MLAINQFKYYVLKSNHTVLLLIAEHIHITRPQAYRHPKTEFSCMLKCYKHNQFLISSLVLQKKCDLKHPPGDEIYRSGTLSMFEVSLYPS